MNTRLTTPFGKINLYTNGIALNYSIEKLENEVLGLKNKPIFIVDDRYRITVYIDGSQIPISIECKFADSTIFSESTVESGERLALKSWYKDNLKISIGTEDEIKGLYVKYLNTGLQVDITDKELLDNIVFGIAWLKLKDLKKEDSYTWFAADPSIS
ncbi:hypothetical protein [Flavobacterium sp. H4147]|uniref:hypothetical protein n=1 Tax=Flavobacterium sp. H4147 TaxID=3034149 RepID=UPI0023EDC3AB|nr:hypothetical protein [Flavobacterium sp. H4147]